MIKYIVLFLILCSTLVLAYNPDDPLAIINYGQNATLKLHPFTREYVKINEGSSVQFSIYDEKNRIKSYNTLIIKDIGQEETSALLSIKGKSFENINFKLGEDKKIDFNGSIPFMFVKEDTLHYDTNAENKYIILLFNVPQFQVKKFNPNDTTGNAVVDFEGIQGSSVKESVFTPLRVGIIALGLIVVLITIFLFKKSE